MRIAVVALVIASGLAGCTGDDGPHLERRTTSTIEGWVFDERVVPLPGAAVRIVGGNATLTDSDGYFRFTDVPVDEYVTIVAEADEFQRGSAVVHQWARGIDYKTNITLVRVPDTTPWREVTEFQGFIRCGTLVIVGHQHGQSPHSHSSQDCGGGNLTAENVWHMPVEAGITGAVFEVFWQAGTPLAENLVVFIEGVGVDGGEDVLFSFYEGTNGMKGTISRLQAFEWFSEQNGTVRFTILPGAPEQAVAVSAHINQDYEVIATLFYGETPPPTYSFAEAT